MSLVVMKFGGTSVEDPAAIGRTAAIVAGRVALGKQPVVVVSAMAKVTDQLLRAAAAAAEGDRAGALAISSRLRVRHRETTAALVKDSAALLDLIDQEFDSLDEILRGLAAILELTPRISDLIVSYGERLSSRIVAAAFSELGIDAAHVDAREVVITDSNFQKAVPRDALIEQRAQTKLLPLTAQSKVPVMGGFIASNEAGITTTLGRGGSDFTGALIGGALAAEAIEIWTDVEASSPPIPASAPMPCASRSSALKRPPSWPTSAPKSCIRPPSCPPSRRTSPCWCSTAAMPPAKARASPRSLRIARVPSNPSP